MTHVVDDSDRYCANCGKVRSEHKAVTFECPAGLKSRIGYTRFGPDVFASSDRVKPSKITFRL